MASSRKHHRSRRCFLRDATLGALGAAGALTGSCTKQPTEQKAAEAPPPPPDTPVSAAPKATLAPSGDRSRVVVARHSGVTANGAVQEAALGDLVDLAVLSLTGEESVEKAWRKCFSSDEKVGIKVNGLGGPNISTSPLLTKVCVERLQGIGVKPESIIVWDSNRGFLANCGLDQETMWGAQVLTMDAEWDKVFEQGSFRGPLTAIVTKRIDAYINLPIMKDHSISGITLALKNHYGSHQNPSDHHGNHCDPYIADLNTIPAIRDKQRLILCDGTRGQALGGPGYNPQYAWNPNLVLAATDPVAHDTVGWELLEAKRKEFGLQPTMGTGAQPPQLLSAAERGVGTNDLQRIEKVEVSVT